MKVEDTPQQRIEQALEACELFAFLSSPDRSRLAERCSLKDFRADDVLCLEGERGDELYILIDGVLEAYTESPSGGPVVLQRLDEPGGCCGEQALRPGSDGRRGASVRAVADSVVAIMPRAVFRGVLDQDPALGESVATRARRFERRNALLERSTMYRALVVFDQDEGWSREERFEDGDIVFREGEPGDKVYVIQSGEARVTRIEHGSPRLLAVLREGQMFGELAVVESGVRQATVAARGPLELISFHGTRFREAMAHNPEVHEYLRTLRGVYRLDTGLVTQFDGEFLGEPALTTLYKLDDGREIIAHHVVRRTLYSAAIDLPPDSEVDCHVFEDPRRNIRREVDLRDGRVVRIHAEGPWSELGLLHRRLVEGEGIAPDRLADFPETGHVLDVPEARSPTATLCHCLGLTRGTVEAEIARGAHTLEAVAERTGASTVCGGCAGRLATLVGSEGQAVRLVDQVPLLPDVCSFRFSAADEDGKAEPLRDALPGQHVVISAEIDGHWVHRPYTITSDPHQREFREITVKREPHGFFSGWLFEGQRQNARFRLSHPKGRFWVDLDRPEPIVCLVAGIGVTPALAIARTVCRANSGPAVHIDYSARTEQDFACRQELDRLSEECEGVTVHYRCTGRGERLRRQDVEGLAERFPEARFMVCGPGPFQEAVRGYLGECRIADDRIHVEVFTPVGHAPEKAAPPSTPERLATAATVLFSAAYLVQWLAGWQWPELSAWQARFSYQLITGFALLALVAYQWYLPWLRLSGRTRAAARQYRWHKYLGVVAPIGLYLHSQAMGYALLLVLASTFLANAVVGAVDKAVFQRNRTRERYHRPWLAVHVTLSMLVAVLSLWHLYFALAYK